MATLLDGTEQRLTPKAKRVLSLHEEGLSYRLIARNVGLSKNTVMEIVRRQVAVA
jgi:DNA-binding NarL/FixJ family response regulator